MAFVLPFVLSITAVGLMGLYASGLLQQRMEISNGTMRSLNGFRNVNAAMTHFLDHIVDTPEIDIIDAIGGHHIDEVPHRPQQQSPRAEEAVEQRPQRHAVPLDYGEIGQVVKRQPPAALPQWQRRARWRRRHRPRYDVHRRGAEQPG